MLAGCVSLRADVNRPVVFVGPFNVNAARWTAVICALEKLREGFDERVQTVCGPEPAVGSRVVITPENRSYLYGGRHVDGSIELRCIDCPTSSMKRRISAQRIRVQSTGGRAGTLTSVQSEPPAHPISSMLGCDPMGNPNLFGDGIILIDSKSGMDVFRSSASIISRAKTGSLHDFDPTGKLVTVHRSALDLIDSHPSQILTVIVNGAHRLDSLAELHELVRHRLIVFASPHDLPRLGRLKGDADFWFFVDDPWLADAADDTSIRLHHLAERDWTPQLVANSVVEKAALALGRFCALLNDTDESPAHGLAGPAWGLLLELAGRTRGFSDNQCRAFKLQIQQFDTAAARVAQSLTPEMNAEVRGAITLMSSASEVEVGATNSKGVAIYELLGKGLRTVLVTRSENEAKSLRSRFTDVRVLTQSELPFDERFEQIVVCGWLGAQRMGQLLLSAAAPRVVLIGYGFEVVWLRSLVGRLQRREGIVTAEGGTKLDIISAPEALMDWPAPALQPTMDTWPDPKVLQGEASADSSLKHTWNDIDIWNFEYQVKHRRKEPETCGVNAPPLVEPVTVRYVSFAGSGYAFLTSERSLPVITELLRVGEKAIQTRRVLELQPGDLVVFPKLAGSDLIAEVANKLLQDRADGLRMRSNQYVAQLRSSRLTPEQFRAAAQKHKLFRSLATVREWFAGSRVIGPDTDQDIEIIQRVVGGTTWATQCIEARHALKQAHAVAEGRIRQALLQKLEQSLDQIEACGCQLELGELGSVWVQCVESVSEQAEVQPKSKTNRLLGVE
jgi:hypothetical protein